MTAEKDSKSEVPDAARALDLLGQPKPGREPSRLESGSARRGPPDEIDQDAIARSLLASSPPVGDAALPERDPTAEAKLLAGQLLDQAREAMRRLESDGANANLSDPQVIALEAVIHVRGRPALRFEGERVEALDETKHPGSGFWRPFLDTHEDAITRTASGTGAIVVKDSNPNKAAWVQGTAWLVRDDLAITNRHVLFPPLAPHLARRDPHNSTKAQLRTDIAVTIDMAFDNGMSRNIRYAIVDVLFVSSEADPVDVAVLQLKRIAATGALPSPKPLTIAATTRDLWAVKQVFVVGHPGKMADVPREVAAVFNTPDERKRVSFGELRNRDPGQPIDLIHDASTIGGYSGGCVLGFGVPEVVGLHYWGKTEIGNRAITATALRAHAVNAVLRF